jgi:seryl-tRNA synthetase
MKSYFPKAPVDVVAGGLAANCTDEQYKELLEQMAPIAEQVAEKLNLQYLVGLACSDICNINKVVKNMFKV